MKFFNVKNDQLIEVDQNPFKLEKDIQNLLEKNLESIFNLRFIKSELSVDKYRIDTLCFDEESNSFVIVEYKKGSSYSVIDQGYTYLQLLINNKSDFLLELSHHFNKVFGMNDIDWSQSRIIFVSPSYNSYQKDSVNFKDLPFELWEIKRFKSNTIILTQHHSTSNESIDVLSQPNDNSIVSKVRREVKVYTEDLHSDYSLAEISDIYFELKERILELGSDIEIVPRKEYIGFKRGSNFVDFEFQKKQLKVFINMKSGSLDDPMEITRDVSNVGHYGNGDYQISVNQKTDLDYLMVLIKQSYSIKGS
jgi:predicted transport protein